MIRPAVTFTDFFAARDFGAKKLKGFPAWLVFSLSGDLHAVMVRPNGPFVDENGEPTTALPKRDSGAQR